MSALRQRIGNVNSWLLVLLTFCLPLSTSAITAVVLLILACWLIEGRFREKWEEIVANPMCLAILVYFGVMLLGLCWTDDVLAGFEAMRKQWKILLVPVLLTTVRWERRWWAVASFIAGVTVAGLLIWLARLDLLAVYIGGANVSKLSTLLTNHIVLTPMIALSIYLLLHQALWGQVRAVRRWSMLALACLLTLTLFITNGRAGQLVFFVLLVLLILQRYRRNLGRGALVALILLPLVFTAGYQLSPVFQQRVDMVRQEIMTFDKNPNTSVGLRLLYWKNSWEIITQSPWFGVGTGGFKSTYAQVNGQRSPDIPPVDNPHNQYILTAVQLGVAGVLALLGIFGTQIYLAGQTKDGWERIRLAFPLFFMTIILTDSYLNTVNSAFLFSSFSAVFFKGLTIPQSWFIRRRRRQESKRYWLILSYRANIPGAACSQHIDDRLPLLEQMGITPILLSGPVGERCDRWQHHRTWSIAPSGIRFELRHYLRNRLHSRWQFKILETIVLLPVLPFYLLEKICINLESEWSWFAGAAFRGFFLIRHYRPEVIYSTGGSASAHLAALLLQKCSSAQWIAETQDPLVHDHEWTRSQRVFRLYKWLEKRVAARSQAFVFLTRQALENARARVGEDFRGVVIYPGATKHPMRQRYTKGELCRFAHFGSLAGSRNLVVFFQALHLLVQEHPEEGQRIRVDIYGSFDRASKKRMHKERLEAFVTCHGLVDRQTALRAMNEADCLVLIQNTSFFSTETIPSKVYEYFLSDRPILGLVHQNSELAAMLNAQSHVVAAADSPIEVKNALREILALHATTPFVWERSLPPVYTTEQAVLQLLTLVENGNRKDAQNPQAFILARGKEGVCPEPS